MATDEPIRGTTKRPELTAEVGFSEETRACSNSLSSIIGHLDDRPLVVTRNLVSELLKDSDCDD